MTYTEDMLTRYRGASADDFPITTRMPDAERAAIRALAEQHGVKPAHITRTILAAVVRGDHVTTGVSGLLIRKRAT